MMTFGSLFAGIGGFDLGLERAGMQCLWQVEIDDYATKILEKHWPDVTRFRDVRECGAHNLTNVDLICGGFPCQDVSLAGKRAGLNGQRTTLWTEFARIISEVRPKWVLAENVSGLLSSDDGQFFGNILRDLAACGYDAEWDCIPAAVFGAPHKRQRVYIIAYPNSKRLHKNTDEEIICKPLTFIEDTRYFSSMGSSGIWIGPRPIGARSMGVDDGIPSRVDRLRCLGNAIVPQVAEWIGRRIIEADRG